MNIFLAGAITANLNPFWKKISEILKNNCGRLEPSAVEEAMNVFLAGGESRHWIHHEILEDVKKNDMQLYLAGQNGKNRIIDAIISRRSMALETGGGGMTKLLLNIILTSSKAFITRIPIRKDCSLISGISY